VISVPVAATWICYYTYLRGLCLESITLSDSPLTPCGDSGIEVLDGRSTHISKHRVSLSHYDEAFIKRAHKVPPLFLPYCFYETRSIYNALYILDNTGG
jgi:hypothetical protein